MAPGNDFDVPADGNVLDHATLYLCRRGAMWAVVIESPRVTGALRLDQAGSDPYDARFELLSRARRACPDAAIVSTDGALESADYEWRLEVQGVEAHPGDLGVALHDELAATTGPPTHATQAPPSRRRPRLSLGIDSVLGPAAPLLTRPQQISAVVTPH